MVFRSQSVADIVRRINTQLVLPPWKTELRCSQAQVMLLFDRLMVEHSLGTFHFWEADQQNRARWPLYRFRLFQRPEEERSGVHALPLDQTDIQVGVQNGRAPRQVAALVPNSPDVEVHQR